MNILPDLITSLTRCGFLTDHLSLPHMNGKLSDGKIIKESENGNENENRNGNENGNGNEDDNDNANHHDEIERPNIDGNKSPNKKNKTEIRNPSLEYAVHGMPVNDQNSEDNITKKISNDIDSYEPYHYGRYVRHFNFPFLFCFQFHFLLHLYFHFHFHFIILFSFLLSF